MAAESFIRVFLLLHFGCFFTIKMLKYFLQEEEAATASLTLIWCGRLPNFQKKYSVILQILLPSLTISPEREKMSLYLLCTFCHLEPGCSPHGDNWQCCSSSLPRSQPRSCIEQKHQVRCPLDSQATFWPRSQTSPQGENPGSKTDKTNQDLRLGWYCFSIHLVPPSQQECTVTSLGKAPVLPRPLRGLSTSRKILYPRGKALKWKQSIKLKV